MVTVSVPLPVTSTQYVWRVFLGARVFAQATVTVPLLMHTRPASSTTSGDASVTASPAAPPMSTA